MYQQRTYGICKRENIPFFRITNKRKTYSRIEFDLNTITTKDNLFHATRKYWSLNFEIVFKDYLDQDLIRTKDMVKNGTFRAFECKTDIIDEVYQRFMSITNIFIYKFLEADDKIKARYNMPLTKRNIIKRQRVKRIRPRCGILINKNNANFSGRGDDVR